MWKPFSRGDSLYVWNHVAQDGDSFLRIFFVKSLSLSHGSKADVRRRFSQLTEVLQVSLEPNYWSVRCNSAPSVELLGMMRNALGEHQGWSAEKTVKMQMLEITSVGDYRAMIKQYPRAGWNLKEGD